MSKGVTTMFAEVELDRDYAEVSRPRPALSPLAGATACGHEECERMEEGIREDVLSRCVDEGAPAVRIPFRGGHVLAKPLDTRRFVRAMARHVSFN